MLSHTCTCLFVWSNCVSHAAACPVANFKVDPVDAVTTVHQMTDRVTERDEGHGQSTTALGKDR